MMPVRLTSIAPQLSASSDRAMCINSVSGDSMIVEQESCMAEAF
jgi:hypothetical protein